MGLAEIVKKINQDSEKKVKEILEEAEEKKKEILLTAQKEGEKLKERLLSEGKERIRRERERKLVLAELELKQKILSQKRKIIDELKKELERKILELPREKYQEMFFEFLLPLARGGEEVVPGEKDQDKFDNRFISLCNQELKRVKKKEISLSKEVGTFSYGLLLKKEKVETKISLQMLIKSIWEKGEKGALEILFS